MKKKSKLNVYVVRKKNNGSIMGESAPCLDCYKKMMEIGVKNIIYSAETENGIELIKQRLRDYTPKTITLGRQFIDGGMVPIHRDKAHLRIIETTNTSSSDDSESDNGSVCSDTSYQSTTTTTSYISIKSKKNRNRKYK